jgi:four helix bundle protein
MGKTSYELSLEASVEVVVLCDGIKGHREQVSQILRSSSSVSANLSEARYAESTADFIHKVKIARKECFETETWLSLMRDSGIISDSVYKPLINKYGRIRRMLTSAINTVSTKYKTE